MFFKNKVYCFYYLGKFEKILIENSFPRSFSIQFGFPFELLEENKNIPQYVHFRCRRVRINVSLKKKQVLVIYYNPRYQNKKGIMMKFMKIRGKLVIVNGYFMLRMTYYQQPFVTLETK